MSDGLPIIGQLLAGRYRIQSVLGEGGYGMVYRARQDGMGRDVAIKVLKPEASKKKVEVERFRREVFHASGLRHPNTITLHDFGQSQELFYIVMEYLEGCNLRESLMATGAMEHDDALDIILQVLRSLREAHQRGIVHRDLKPENIFLCDVSDGERHVKVLDFGLSKYAPNVGEAETNITKEGVIFGTPQYMSPEQAYGQPVSPAADVYAVGLLIYEMLTGNCAFTGRSSMEILIKQVSQPVPALPHQLRGTLLDAFMTEATAKETEDRFASADVALKWLERKIKARSYEAVAAFNNNVEEHKAPEEEQAEPVEDPVEVGIEDLNVRLTQLPLFGRENELGQIIEWSSQSKTTGGIASLVGDVGIGKSRMIDEWVNQLTLDGVIVLRGRYHEDGTELEGLRQALRPVVNNQADTQTIPSVLTLDTIKALHDIVNPGADSIADEEVEARGQHWRYVAIEEALATVARTKPVALVLEDIHWADSFTIGLLMHWQEEFATRTIPMILIYSSRIHEIDSAAQLNELSRLGQKYSEVSFAFHQTLQPLTDDDTRDLINYLLPMTDDTARYILDRASGNPLFATELVRFFAESSAFAFDETQQKWFLPRVFETDVPPNVRELILRRLHRLVASSELGEVLSGIFTRALLLGHQFKLRELNELLAQENRVDLKSRLDDAIDVLLNARFLKSVIVDGQPGLEFTYDIVRDVLLDIPPIRSEELPALHRAIANQKEASYSDGVTAAQAAEIAFHYQRSGEPREQYEWLTTASRIAEGTQDFREALHYYRDAEGILNPTLDPSGEKLLNIRLALGRCYKFLGEFGPAEFALGSAHEEAKRVGDLVGEALAGELLAEVHILQGNYEAADALYHRVSALYAKFPDPLGQLRCTIGIAEIKRFRGEYKEAERMFTEASEIAEAHGDHVAASRCAFGMGQCAYGAGRLDQAREIFQRARKRAEAVGDVKRVSDADIEISLVSVRTDGVAKAEQLAKQALEVKRSIGDTTGAAYAHLNIGIALRRSARLEEAEFHCRRAQGIAERLNHPDVIAKAVLLSAEIAWVRGDLEYALERAREAERLHADLGDMHGYALAKSFSALFEVESGNSEKARQLAEASIEIGRKKGLGLYHAQFILLHAMVCEREDNLEEALAYYGEALQRAEMSGNRETASLAASGLTAVHVSLGDFEALKEDVPIARSQAEHLGNNIAMSFAIAAEALLAKIDNNLERQRESLETLRKLNDSQPGLKIPDRIYRVAIRALQRQNPKKGTITASAIAELLESIGAEDYANRLRSAMAEGSER